MTDDNAACRHDQSVAPDFEFHLRATQADREGYYYTNWGNAVPIVIRAATKQQAINRADAALGPCRHSTQYWVFKTDRIESVTR